MGDINSAFKSISNAFNGQEQHISTLNETPTPNLNNIVTPRARLTVRHSENTHTQSLMSMDVGDVTARMSEAHDHIDDTFLNANVDESAKQADHTTTKDAHPDHGYNHVSERVCEHLCCVVCLALPATCYQCPNGHLMCETCLNRLLADAHLEDQAMLCPTCRCVIKADVCTRNFAAENIIAELPGTCPLCSEQMSRSDLQHHKQVCQLRPSECRFSLIGCQWRGAARDVCNHEKVCKHPSKSGKDVMEFLEQQEASKTGPGHAGDILSLLSCGETTFCDLKLNTYYSDTVDARLYHESRRFTAFGKDWRVKAKIQSSHRDPRLTVKRSLSYQLLSKSRRISEMTIYYLILIDSCFLDGQLRSKINKFNFSQTESETEFAEFEMSPDQFNALLSLDSIDIRLVMIHLPNP